MSSATNSSARIANPPCQADVYDRIIRATDNDAATSRLSAVDAGYLDDPFAHLLYDTSSKEISRRLPLMNRGTYARTTGIDRVVDTFMVSYPGQRKQIMSLGAGSDTRYFRMRRKNAQVDVLYQEFDFTQNTQAKIKRLRSPAFAVAHRQHCDSEWSYSIPESEPSFSSLTSDSYTLSPLDLRSLSSADATKSDTTATANATAAEGITSAPTPLIDPYLPTLIISEMCLCYLTPAHATSVLQYFHTLIAPPTPLSIVIYEPIHPGSPFGRTMTSNLKSRGISLPTLDAYQDLAAQKKRLADHGFTSGQQAVDLNTVWKQWTTSEERERVEALEWLDEVEEMELLGSHYGLIWSWREAEASESQWTELKS